MGRHPFYHEVLVGSFNINGAPSMFWYIVMALLGGWLIGWTTRGIIERRINSTRMDNVCPKCGNRIWTVGISSEYSKLVHKCIACKTMYDGEGKIHHA